MPFASALFQRFKRAARVIATGEVSRFADDENVGFLFTRLRALEDAVCSAPRLSVLVPTLSARLAYGGLATHVELPLLVFQRYLMAKGWSLRFICTGDKPEDSDNIVQHYAAKNGLEDSAVDYSYANESIAVSPKDVFLGSLWQSYYDALPLLDFQASVLGKKRVSYVSLLQDYEAGFHPWSSAYMMALAFYETPGNALVFNSRELERYYITRGHPAEERAVFEPVMNAGLAQLMTSAREHKKQRQIVVYARPQERRNCFYVLRRALEEWSYSYPRAREWKVVAVGAANVRMALKPGVQWENRAKLSIETYAGELARSAVGVSLMASPHPSYPPLEMAHYGALTITNSFPCKDLSSWHENIRSLEKLTPPALASAIADACDRFDADSQAGLNGKSHKPGYVLGYSDETLADIGQLIASVS